MGKTGKWIRSFLTGKKEKDKDRDKEKENNSSFTDENLATPIGVPPTTPKEKRRWSFRRSSAMGVSTKDTNSMNLMAVTPPVVVQAKLETENEQRQQAMTVAAATAAADAVINLTDSATGTPITVKEAAAIKIQAVFRSHLARKALRALKGLVKLQALVRGYLVRKQANTTLRCMQALLTVQARAVAHRIQVAEGSQVNSRKRSINRKSPQENWFRQVYRDMERGVEENIKIVEMDICELRGSSKTTNAYSSHPQIERAEHRMSTYSAHHHSHSKPENHQQISPVPSALTDMSPRAFSGYIEEPIYSTEQSSPHYYSAVSKSNSTKAPYKYSQTDDADSVSQDYPFFPNYMANTESSKAKFRSHSAPKQRPDTCERQPNRRRASMEGRNVPQGVRMQRSSSHVGSAAHGYRNPWSIKLGKSMVSLKDSECGSTSTVLTNNNYYGSLVVYEPHGYIY